MIFGQVPIDPEVLATRLVSELTKAVPRQGTAVAWTRNLKMILRKMGKELGHTVSPDPDDDNERQFLLDLVWWRNSKYMDIVLAVESEWQAWRDVCHDFGKLLVVKSPLKLMTFDKQKEDTTKAIEELYMRRFTQHVEGEQYLLLEFNAQKNETKPFHFVVPSNGKLSSAEFRKPSPILWARS